MPSLFLQEVLKYCYPLDRSLGYIHRDGGLPIDYFFTFEPLSNPQNNYITNKEVKTDDINEDIWRPEVRIRYGNQTDNNNGLMLVEVTQRYRDNGDVQNYGDMLDIKVSFALGFEEVGFWHDHLKEKIALEAEFDRLVSMEEFACRTFYNDNEEVQKETKKYIKHVRGIMALANVKEVYAKGGKKKRDELEKHIRTCIDELTKDLPEKVEIEVPLEFKNIANFYK